ASRNDQRAGRGFPDPAPTLSGCRGLVTGAQVSAKLEHLSNRHNSRWLNCLRQLVRQLHSAAEPPSEGSCQGCSFLGHGEVTSYPQPKQGTPMQRFLQRFALLVAGTLPGLDRLVFRGKLCQLYSPQGMNCLLSANHVLYKDYKSYAAEVTAQVIAAAGVPQAKAQGRYRYLPSSKTDKEAVAREFAAAHRVKTGLVCILQCIEPAWTFDWAKTPDGRLTVRNGPGK